MIICHCKAKTDRHIRDAAHEGATTCREVGQKCDAGTDCGGCLRAIQAILARELANRVMAPHSQRAAV